MKKLRDVILAGTLILSSPNIVKADDNIKIKEVVINTKQQTIDALNMELMLILNEIYSEKSDNISDFLHNYTQVTWEYISKMSDTNFKLIIEEVYFDNSKITDLKNNKKYNREDFEYILGKHKKDLEKYFDNIFWIMISQGESERAFLYMWYLSDKFWYKFNNFSKNYFSLEMIPKWLIKDNLEKFIKKINILKTKKEKIEFIENLTPQDFFEKDYFVLDNFTRKIIDVYISIIKTKLKELYIN